MDHLGDMKMFVAVVEAQGFSAASRNLSVPIPTVCRRIANLENKLGVQLLVRSTRKTVATESGRRYYEDVRRILEDIHSAERLAVGEYEEVTGVLTLTAPSLFTHKILLPVIHDFMDQYRKVQVRLMSSNHVLDMLNDHIDLGVKIAPIANDNLHMTEIGSMRLVVCASPAYLANNNLPITPDDLHQHRTITFSKSCDEIPWSFNSVESKRLETNVHSMMLVNSAEAAIESTLLGTGLTQVYLYQVASQIESGALQVVLQEYEPVAVPVCLSIPKGQNSPQKVKAFIEFAKPVIERQLQRLNQISLTKFD